MKNQYFFLLLICLGFTTVGYGQTSTFSTPGGPYAYTVPPNVTSIGVDMKAGSGGTGSSCAPYGQAGKGGRVQCTLAVTPGQVLYVFVGGAGVQAPCCCTYGSSGGTNGGGASRFYYAAGGGGASDIRTVSGSYTLSAGLSSRLVVAGGGGGAGYGSCCTSTYNSGGDGGGTTGHAGYYSGSSPYSTSYTGGGGSQSAGGSRGTSCSNTTTGSLGVGGLGGTCLYGGGGGGGYYGGGGAYRGGGGGGSSFPASNGGRISNLTHTQGNNTGNGSVVICAPTVGTLSGNAPLCSGNTLTLTSTGSGGTWNSTNPSVATISTGGVVTGLTAGTTTISYSLSVSGCGAGVATAVVTVNANPSAITGTTVLCSGNTSSLSSTSGGTWTSSNAAVASVGSSSGVLSGVSAGTATITYTMTGGCFVTAASTVNLQPASITGSVSALCGGSVPTSTSLGNTTSGGVWSSNSGAAAVGSTGLVTGVSTGNAVISYTIPTGGCFSTYPVTVNSVADIVGPLSLCNGTTVTLSDATASGAWSSSSPGVATISGSGVVTGVSLSSTNISYTVSSTGCSAVRTEYVTTTPNVYSMTGGGVYCSGGVGVHVGLSLTDADVSYQLYNGATAVGSPSIGNGGTLDFGLQTGSGPYGAIANEGTACATTMSGTATVSVNPLPTQYSVTGGGAYCSGGSGLHVYLSSSVIGTSYQLYDNGSPVGAPFAGTSASIDFGAYTSAGAYTVRASNTATSCINDMSDSATVSINPLPAAFTVTGGGGYCTGGTGVHVGLSNSVAGVSYQLMLAGAPVGAPLTGTGASLDFGLMTTAGTYTVAATDGTTSCQNSMSGSVTVVINPLPTPFTVIGGGSYCSGGTGVPVGVNGSAAGVNYQLYSTVGATTSAVGSPAAGTGSSISFGNKTTAAAYTVVATNATTGCVNNMLSSVSVSINPLPASFSLTGGGGYCIGGMGVPVGLNGSAAGTTYQLFDGATLVGATTGTSGAVSFGLQRAAGIYTVTGTTGLGCTGNMPGSVTITINSLPTVFAVTGGGNFCAGGSGVNVGLSGSSGGVRYQLFNGTTPIGTGSNGTGGAINFGSQTTAGGYTVVAYNTSTTCSSNMSGAATVGIDPTPVVYAVTGGGSFCAGGTGVDVALASSDAGINYQLMNGGAVGSSVPGSGGMLDFGMITSGGTYSVVATNPANGCTATMGGSAPVVVNALPAVFSVNGSSNYCAGSAGMPVNLSGSASGINYQLFSGSSAVTVVAGTGSVISFGLQTAGSYTAIATDAATGCSSNMTGIATIGVNPLPAAFMTTGGGDYCAGGAGVHIGLAGSAPGISYQLMNGTAPAGLATGGTGAAIDFGLQTNAGTYTIAATDPATTCSTTMTGAATVNIDALPSVFTITGGGNYCAGGTGVHVGMSSSATGVNYQLYRGGGATGIPVAGTGFPLDYGLQTTAGSYTIVATDAATGCVLNMPGSTAVIVDPLPVLHTITGGGSYCAGGTGVNVGLDNSNTGTNYQLYNGAVAVGSAATGLTGAPVNFGLQTTNGIYTVMATTSAGCAGSMLGVVNVGTYALPAVYNVSGGGNYCAGSAGVNVGLSGSNTGIQYQLYSGSTPLGGFIAGTGGSLGFGLQTNTGSYSVIATDPTSACTSTMNGSATVGVNPLPVPQLVSGGGHYCSGSGGVSVGLNGSVLGTSYQLYDDVTAVGSPFAGTGLPIDFGLQLTPGTYTVVAATAAMCSNTMTGSATINADPLPNTYTLSGGGNFCSGGTGVDLTLSSSDAGVNYQLYNGTTPVGAPMTGTGFAIDFGMQTAPGTYTAAATNGATMCARNMSGSVIITVTPVPVAYTVSGGGNYCAGGSGVSVTLAASDAGVTYQLFNSGVPVASPIAGTGTMLDFGAQTTPGNYSVVATNIATTCTNSMTGSVSVGINALPAAYSMSTATSHYCSGSGGVDIQLSGSDAGVNYQLFNGGTTMGSPVSGSGAALDFGFWLPSGSYSVVATNASTGCVNSMSGHTSVAVDPLPNVYAVTGGGSYCGGAAGTHVGLSGSDAGIAYQLFSSSLPFGSVVAGSGAGLDFGLQTAGSYNVVAVNVVTGCTNAMTGSATVVMNTPPAAFAVTGGGNYCAGGTGSDVGLSGSATGVSYSLYRGGAVVGGAIPGTGVALDFGLQLSGTYTIVAMDAASGCSGTMAGSAVVGINAAPSAFAVTGGGNFCSGGAGVHISLVNSTPGVDYQLFNGSTSVGSPVSGIGAGIDFGSQTAAGSYTVQALNTVTGCTANMTGAATVIVNTPPAVYNVTGGGNFCIGSAGSHVGLNSSAAGINYSLFSSSAMIRTLPGTGGPLDFGLQNVADSYSVIAIDATTGCSGNMSGRAVIVAIPVVTPHVFATADLGDSVCAGSFVTYTVTSLNAGSSPAYRWTVNGVAAGIGDTYAYTPSDGDVVSVTLTSSADCATPTSVTNTVNMNVDPQGAPAVNVSATPGAAVCQGTSVAYAAVPAFGGSAPSYVWTKNGATVSTAPGFSYTPADGDIIAVTLTSNYRCRLANSATSPAINMEVDIPSTPVVTIGSYPAADIAAGQAVTFTAGAASAGSSPTYQWLLNSTLLAGATNSNYVTNNLANGDVVSCNVTTGGSCPGITGSGSVTVHVFGVGVQQVGSQSDIQLLPNPNKGTFVLKGSVGTTETEATVEVTDLLGKVVYKGSISVNGGMLNQKIQMNNMANGMYILNLRCGAASRVYHMVIEQ